MPVLIILFFVFVWVCLAWWVHKDTKQRGIDGDGWTIGVLFLGVFVFLPYMLSRSVENSQATRNVQSLTAQSLMQQSPTSPPPRRYSDTYRDAYQSIPVARTGEVKDEVRRYEILKNRGFVTDAEFTIQSEALVAAELHGDITTDRLTATTLIALADRVERSELSRADFDVEKSSLLWKRPKEELVGEPAKEEIQESPSSPTFIADELTKLAKLRESGLLTQQEFDSQKQSY